MTDSGDRPVSKRERVLKTIREYLVSFLLAVFIALTIRHFVIEPFKIPSASMVPTLLVGDFIFVNKFKYGFQIPFKAKRFVKFKDPKRGEVIVFIYPKDEKKDFIKRVIGVEGDKINMKGNVVYVNGEPVGMIRKGTYTFKSRTGGFLEKGDLFEEKIGKRKHKVLYTDVGEPNPDFEFLPTTVPKGHVFVMGDNRDNSLDSRAWGFVPLDNLKGEALFIWFSLDKHYDKIFNIVRWNRLFTGIK